MLALKNERTNYIKSKAKDNLTGKRVNRVVGVSKGFAFLFINISKTGWIFLTLFFVIFNVVTGKSNTVMNLF